MVDPSWGVESLSASTVTFKIPYALGLICASTTTVQTIALLPVDSVTFALPGYSGFATRASDGTYSTISGGTLVESSSFPASCTTAGIQQLTAPSSAPNQKTRIITITLGSPLGAVIETGTPIMLYRRVSYYFGSSAQSGLTSRTALWRDYLDDAVAATEMVAPFDAAAAFKFWVSSSSSVQTAPPGTLTTLRGLEFYLPGESDRTSRQKSSPEEADMTTDVYFVNRAS
jgi:hypothetical protein